MACQTFLNLTKAYDVFNHQMLLGKLECYGIRGICNQWFQSYLPNSKQLISHIWINALKRNIFPLARIQMEFATFNFGTHFIPFIYK